MPELFTTDPPLVTWLLLPLFIFVARATDIGLSTLRIASIAQGRTAVAAGIGFFEALIWLFVVSQILQHLDNPAAVVAYAGGFAAGNWLGLTLERKLALGMQVVRIITQRPVEGLTEALSGAGYGVTLLDGQGAKGPVNVLFTVVRRRDVPRVAALVEQYHPRAFYSVEDIRSAAAGVIPGTAAASPLSRLRLALRKAK